MSTTKAAGTAKNVRDSNPQYLGVKIFGGQTIKAGQIIIRQRGTHFTQGANVGMGKDHTLFALCNGIVRFATKRKLSFNRTRRLIKVVHVDPSN